MIMNQARRSIYIVIAKLKTFSNCVNGTSTTPNRFKIGLTVRTRTSEGILVFVKGTGGDKHVLLHYNSSHLIFDVNFGEGLRTSITLPAKLSDGISHKVVSSLSDGLPLFLSNALIFFSLTQCFYPCLFLLSLSLSLSLCDYYLCCLMLVLHYKQTFPKRPNLTSNKRN